jgi:hypothetical protein
VFTGLVFLIALGIMVLINLMSFMLGTMTVEYNLKILEAKDERMNATEEMLSIIKHIKTNAQ